MTPEEFARRHGVTIATARENRGQVYVTREGDNLTALARKFYRTPSRAAVMKIFNANRQVLSNPNALGVGVKLVIPK